MTRWIGAGVAVAAALAIAAVSTAGDFIWAMWIPRHRPIYGLTHGTLLLLCIGLSIGAVAKKPGTGAAAGALLGFLSAGSFYVLVRVAGYAAMFAVWFGMWVALALINARLNPAYAGTGAAMVRGLLAGIASGAAFFLISGIWFPFNPQGWDYLAHFAGWSFAYFSGFAVLFIARRP